ncbi:MAG: hypothetical protein IJ939_05070 [Clostridia bacterium]|nr:hypothetical protein [Clostridia bacterium]
MSKIPTTHEEFIEAGYTATELLRDTDFVNGFAVHGKKRIGEFRDYCENEEKLLKNFRAFHSHI